MARLVGAVRQWLIPAQQPELLTFSLDGREHLAGVKVAGPNLQGYSKLQEVAHV